MARRPNATSLLPLAIDRTSSIPFYQQLYSQFRYAILDRRLTSGELVPSSRTLAHDLAIARTTVVSALDQLVAEGYLVAQQGAGYRVARDVPDDAWGTTPTNGKPFGGLLPSLSERGQLMASLPSTGIISGGGLRAFRVGVPAVDAFPLEIWRKIAVQRQQQIKQAHLHTADPAGEAELRTSIVAYVRSARGVVCDADQVIVCTGSQQALDLIIRLLLDPGDAAWVEDPGYLGARSALQAAGAQVVPVPVDSDGLIVAQAVAQAPQARAAYVTPAHHYPLGVSLSLPRRLALLEWAAQANAWVLEGDYDGEYRYSGRPLAALQGLDPSRVCYFGTFSKTMFPTLRLGYVIVPPTLVEPMLAARQIVDLHPPVIEQLIMADFIASGHFARHVRRMRQLYITRQKALREMLAAQLGDLLDIPAQPAGMQVLAWLPPSWNDRAVSHRLASFAIESAPLSAYCVTAKLPPALMLGFAGLTDTQIETGVQQIAHVLREVERAISERDVA